MKLTEAKSNLSRLMSEENLLVEQRSGVQSAFFDTKNRLLVVPEFKEEVSSNVIDLMLSHEVGHALYTPSDKWSEAITEGKINKSILNCVEDARIEKKIKSKYPGLRKIYHFGYSELMRNDFFGTSTLDIETLNLADKINLQFKVGFVKAISFSEEEKQIVDQVDRVETFEDAVKAAKIIQEYVKQEMEGKFEEIQNENVEENLEMGSGESLENFEGYEGEIGEYQSEEYNEGGFDNSAESFGESLESSQFSDAIEDLTLEEFLEENLRSHTQEFSEENIKNLYKDDGRPSVYVDIPAINLNEYVVGYKTIFGKLNECIEKVYINHSAYNTFKVENNSVISYLIKEFNLKKDAKGRKKVRISKTGDINPNKLYSYNISDDIFKRSAVVPKAQSHGLVFFLDWSGSMQRILRDTINQLIVLISFCKKVNIPFEVYAFSSNRTSPYKIETENEVLLNPLCLLNLFSSTMSTSEFKEACNFLLSFDGHSFSADRMNSWSAGKFGPFWFSLGNTPLNHTILLSNAVMEDFKSKTKVQITNAIYLTDGESHGITYFTKADDYRRSFSLTSTRNNVYLRDKRSKEVMRFVTSYNKFGETDQCVKFVKKFCDFRTMGFRLTNARELKTYYRYNNIYETSGKMKEFNRNNVLEMDTEFDKFFFVKSNISKEENGLGEIGDKSSAQIAKTFTNVLSKKVNTKIFLRKFAEFIS